MVKGTPYAKANFASTCRKLFELLYMATPWPRHKQGTQWDLTKKFDRSQLKSEWDINIQSGNTIWV